MSAFQLVFPTVNSSPSFIKKKPCFLDWKSTLTTCSLQPLTMAETVEIPETLKPISWLAGRWTTQAGHGKYPNVSDFQYHDVLEFICIGQPMLNFSSSSTHPVKQTPMHQERGFLRIKPGTNDLAFVVSHNFGLTSLEEGKVDPTKQEIVLETINVSRISFAKQPYVKKFKRVFQLIDANTLEVTTFMETEDTPLTEHLMAVYKKE